MLVDKSDSIATKRPRTVRRISVVVWAAGLSLPLAMVGCTTPQVALAPRGYGYMCQSGLTIEWIQLRASKDDQVDLRLEVLALEPHASINAPVTLRDQHYAGRGVRLGNRINVTTRTRIKGSTVEQSFKGVLGVTTLTQPEVPIVYKITSTKTYISYRSEFITLATRKVTPHWIDVHDPQLPRYTCAG